MAVAGCGKNRGRRAVERAVKIDIWSDIVCPFCTIGKRHLQLALDAFPHRDDVEIVWHSFELDPAIEAAPTRPLVDSIAAKYGISREQSQASQEDIARRAAAVGLTFNWQQARFGNTFDAHRLTHLAAAHGLGDEAQARLMSAYFTEGVAIGDPAELQRLGEEIGLPADEVRALLAGDAYADAVRGDEAQAQALGITGVPFFVLDDTFAVSGAQPVELFGQALAQAWEHAHPAAAAPGPAAAQGTSTADPTGAPTGPSCDGDACAL